jgi:hypothetical protein
MPGRKIIVTKSHSSMPHFLAKNKLSAVRFVTKTVFTVTKDVELKGTFQFPIGNAKL